MIRKLSTFILIAMLVILSIPTMAYANDHAITHIFVAQFDQGSYYAAMYTAEDTWQAVKITAVKLDKYEDDLAIDSNGYVISSTLTLESSTFTNNHHRFTWSYLDDADIGTIANVNTHDGITDGTVNGDYAQFNGFAVNGPMYLLKDADPTVQIGAIGWIVQNNNLFSFVVGNGERMSTDLHIYHPVFRVYMANVL